MGQGRGYINIFINPSHEMGKEGVESLLSHFKATREIVLMTNLFNMYI